jgi:hypothetical protein
MAYESILSGVIMSWIINLRNVTYASTLAFPFLCAAQGFNYFDPSIYANAPKKLSLTGLHTSIAGPNKTLISEALPYEVNAPLYSDGAKKIGGYC